MTSRLQRGTVAALKRQTLVLELEPLLTSATKTPAVQELARRLEQGGASSGVGVSPGAQSFLCVVLQRLLPDHFILVITDGPKSQERYAQDLETWLGHAQMDSVFQAPQSSHEPPCTTPGGRSAATPEPGSCLSWRSGAKPEHSPLPVPQAQDPGAGDLAKVEATPKPFATSNPRSRAPGIPQRPADLPRRCVDTSACRPLFFPAWEMLPHESRLPHADVVSDRLETLVYLVNARRAGSRVAITTAVALQQLTLAPAWLRQHTRVLASGDRFEPLDLVEWLEEVGYEPEAKVTQKGELSLRGGILDVFPLTEPWPVRIEFFGDEIESLRHFDPNTQVSRESIPSVTLPPAGELGLLRQACARTPPRDILNGNSPSNAAATRQPAPSVGAKTDAPQPTPAAHNVDGGCGPVSLTGYLPAKTVLVICEPERVSIQADHYLAQTLDNEPLVTSWADVLHEMHQRGAKVVHLTETGTELTGGDHSRTDEVPDSESPADDPSRAEVSLSDEDPPDANGAINLDWRGLEAFRPLTDKRPDQVVMETQRKEFLVQLHRWLRQGYRVQVVCNNAGERERFAEIWTEFTAAGAPSSVDPSPPTATPSSRTLAEHAPAPAGEESTAKSLAPGTQSPGRETTGKDSPTSAVQARVGARAFDVVHVEAAPGQLALGTGLVSQGFLCETARFVVVTDSEIFGRYRVQRPRRLKSRHAMAARSALDIDFTEFEEGDYVVHVQHGIGRFLGVKLLPTTLGRRGTRSPSVSEPAQECLVIEYAAAETDQEPPKLYVPITEAHLVSKYVGAGKARPPLNTLGSARWNRVKAQAERAIRDLAGDLLSIQAARGLQTGVAYPPDTGWQREFEGSFIYEETPDQLTAIQAAKLDMEAPRPMDRLICGDVGFGKTEVAIRAAFKAVMAGKQVAVLVPTTVLAQQHFNTFRERMADYPLRIELLSRFRTRREQQAVIHDLALGAIDIVIGTHRLVQDDVHFKDLGLVVVDEEQRFGVLQKERFKQLRRMVDVLTLSATPIPRTLYLALTGARDMSTIETPPQDRLPVETIVTAYDERLIRDAIRRELNRQGQVFFLHNRVFSIMNVAQRLQQLVPEARLVVGHGQMDSHDLEKVMTTFVNGDADVLLSTTIIESGLDIPNANTIIIDRADRFGLSDLYQLRGRVGRYRHQAYAYLLLPRHAGLLADARKRLTAIKQYSTLGSGFKIAMRDLEIRGAGNLLGAEQSGHITAVGFELYCQLLKQSIASLKGEKVKRRPLVEMRLDFIDIAPNDTANSNGASPKRLSPDDALWPDAEEGGIPPAQASIPLRYIQDTRQRIEVYRKLAQAGDRGDLESLRGELHDRFGPPPPSVDLLLLVTEVKLLAGDRDISVVETRLDKLMLTRQGDFLTLGGKFPRMIRKTARARLQEIRKLLLAL